MFAVSILLSLSTSDSELRWYQWYAFAFAFASEFSFGRVGHRRVVWRLSFKALHLPPAQLNLVVPGARRRFQGQAYPPLRRGRGTSSPHSPGLAMRGVRRLADDLDYEAGQASSTPGHSPSRQF